MIEIEVIQGDITKLAVDAMTELPRTSCALKIAERPRPSACLPIIVSSC